jgi:hypothetical protein
MVHFSKHLLFSLYISLAVLVFVFVFLVKSLQPLYYFLWVVGVGGYVYKNQDFVAAKLQSLPFGRFGSYLGIGICCILLEEVFASIAMHGMRYITEGSIATFFVDIAQFWMVNLLALPGMLLAWYVLLKRYSYSHTEIFWLAGLFGLFSEKIYLHAAAYPLFGWALIIPTVFTYGLLILLPVLSLRNLEGRAGTRVIRYALALVAPILFSVPFIGILSYIHGLHSELFPPFGFFSE